MKDHGRLLSSAAPSSMLEAAGRAPLAAPYIDLDAVIALARARRSEEIGRVFGALFGWIGAARQRARRRSLERVMARVTDLADIERRMRLLNRHEGLFPSDLRNDVFARWYR